MRREPEGSVLSEVLREHLATFLACTTSDCGPALPAFVRPELRRDLDSGILAHGFARVHSTQSGRDELAAFSCKGRSFRPLC